MEASTDGSIGKRVGAGATDTQLNAYLSDLVSHRPIYFFVPRQSINKCYYSNRHTSTTLSPVLLPTDVPDGRQHPGSVSKLCCITGEGIGSGFGQLHRNTGVKHTSMAAELCLATV